MSTRQNTCLHPVGVVSAQQKRADGAVALLHGDGEWRVPGPRQDPRVRAGSPEGHRNLEVAALAGKVPKSNGS